MSLKSNIRQKIEYQCNNCGKQRILFIAPALQSEKVESHGYSEYADVHICKNNELQAIKLFVDTNYDVRTQVTVESKPKTEIPGIIEMSGFNIPVPKKTEFLTEIIEPTKDFGGYNIFYLEIKDKLRQRKYILQTEKEGKIVSSISPLGFIEIKAKVSEDTTEEFTQEWLISLANTLESLVFLDEELLSYLGIYLDYMITSRPKEKELLELNLLLHSTKAIPHSTDEHISIFEEHVNEIFPELNIVSYRMYNTIMEACFKNAQQTLMNVFEKIREKIAQIQGFPYFISVVSILVSFGFINLEKLEFYTVG